MSDTQKRKNYDDYGPEFFDQTVNSSSSSSTRRSTHRQYNYSHWNQEEFSADELFNLFFGRNYAAASHATHRARHQEGYTRMNAGQATLVKLEIYQINFLQLPFLFFISNYKDNNTVLLQFLPIILIVVLALFSNLMIGEPLYSLQKSKLVSLLNNVKIR